MDETQLQELQKISDLQTAFTGLYILDGDTFKPRLDKGKNIYDSKRKTKLAEFEDGLNSVGINPKSTPKQIELSLQQKYEAIYKLLKQTPKFKDDRPNDMPAKTTWNKDESAQFQEEARIRNEQIAATRENQTKLVEDFIKQNEERIAKAKSLQEKLKDKVVYAKVIIPEEEKLTQTEQQTFETLKKYATDEIPSKESGLTPKQILINDLSVKIKEILEPDLINLTPEEKLIVAQTYAVKLVEEISKPVGDYTIPVQTAILTAIPKEIDAGSKIIQKTIPDDPLIKQAKEGSMALELENRNSQFTTKEISRRIFGEKVTSRVFGVSPEQIVVTFTDKIEASQATYIVNLGVLNKEYEQVLDRQNRFIGEVRRVGVENVQNIFISEGRTLLRDKITKSAVGKFVSKDPVLNAIFAQNVLGDHIVWQVVGQNRLAQLAVDVSPQIAGPVLGFFNKATPIITTAANQTAGKAVVGQVAAKTATKVGFFAKAVGWATKALGLSSGLATFGIGTAVTLIGEQILKRINWHKIKQWFIDNKEMFVFAGAGAGLFFGGPVAGLVAGGLLMAITGTLGTFALGAFGVLGFIGRSVGIAIATPVIVTLLVLPPLVAFIMLVINNSAYVVPPSFLEDATIPPPPIGGLVSSCKESEDTGPEITDDLAGRIKNGVVNLLPETVWGRRDGICIKPTMIVMHWSAGTNDNPDGNQRTYETLVERTLSCQLATDTNDNWLMERFFEKMVEFPACAGSYNTYSINNEMAGVYFTANPPPPNLEELELAYDATCKVMDQYNIPWSQIRGHYQVPNSGKQDPGKEFLEKVFIPEIRKRCPNDKNDIVRNGENIDRADNVRDGI